MAKKLAGVTGTFSADIARFRVKLSGKLDKLARVVALSVFGAVIIGTPVDTGRAAANWQVGINFVPGQSIIWNKPKGGGQEGIDYAQRQTERKVLAEGSAKVKIILINNVSYIRALEEGHSQQRPNGWVHAIIKDWNRRVGEAVRRL